MMYSPTHFEETDAKTIRQFINEHAFGLLISTSNGAQQLSHIPFLYEPEQGHLLGHVARENRHWRMLEGDEPVTVVFQGPHAYVSPSCYQRPGVPTWNYTAVHLRGRANAFDDRDELAKVVQGLSDKYEAGREPRWSGDYNRRLLDHIVGIRVLVDQVQAKFKLSQNRDAADRAAVIENLRASGRANEAAVARLMEDNEH